jgi:tripartite-type tricarboxylate transporter receptor subunit TctC
MEEAMLLSLRTAIVALSVMGGLCSQVQAEPEYPARLIQIVVPFAPATGLDVIARGFAKRLSEQMGISVIVENKDGAGGIVGTSFVRRANANGGTILFTAHPPFAVATLLQKEPSYDPIRDFIPIAKVASVPMVLIASNTAPFHTFQEFVEYARQHPDMNYGSNGVGAPSHLDMELIKKAEGLKIQHVPYKSAGQAMTDVMAGRVPVYMASFAAALPHLNGGTLRGLAIGSQHRAAALPNLPTLAEELKQPGFEATVWYGFLAPAGTPKPIIERLYKEIAIALPSPEIVELMKKFGVDAALSPGDAFATTIRHDAESAHALLTELKLTPSP